MTESTIAPALLRQSWFLVGPTASGKTAVSLELANQLNAEIISLDSMAIYRGMDIGTAKASAEERQRIPHHLIDVADPHQEFSVADFLRMAALAAQQIAGRGKTPLFVGGTGLYLRSALRGLFSGPDASWELRAELEAAARRNGPEWLHRQLQDVDPVTASRLHANDLRRMIRALEVYHLTGKPLSHDQTHRPRPAADRPQAVVWLDAPRTWLHQRIERRVDQMMEDGFEDEVRRLIRRVPPPGRTATQALGYRELIRYIEGSCTREQAVEQTKTGTRQFAKRQVTWFRNLEEVQRLPLIGDETPATLCHTILRMASHG